MAPSKRLIQSLISHKVRIDSIKNVKAELSIHGYMIDITHGKKDNRMFVLYENTKEFNYDMLFLNLAKKYKDDMGEITPETYTTGNNHSKNPREITPKTLSPREITPEEYHPPFPL